MGRAACSTPASARARQRSRIGGSCRSTSQRARHAHDGRGRARPEALSRGRRRASARDRDRTLRRDAIAAGRARVVRAARRVAHDVAQGDRRPCRRRSAASPPRRGHLHSPCEAARRSALVAPDEFYGRHAAARFGGELARTRARRVPADAGRGDDARREAERTRVPARPFAAR